MPAYNTVAGGPGEDRVADYTRLQAAVAPPLAAWAPRQRSAPPAEIPDTPAAVLGTGRLARQINPRHTQPAEIGAPQVSAGPAHELGAVCMWGARRTETP